MRRRIGAMVCCLLLAVQMLPPPQAQAAGYLCFVAVGDSILPLSDDTMPFWRDGFLYVPASSFASGARESLGIGLIANSEQAILYRVSRRGTLRFDAGTDLAFDGDGNSYYPGGVQRGGEMFIPASVVAEAFGLQYSVAEAQFTVNGETVRGDLAWIRRPGSSLTPQVFANAASFTLASRYADYLREQEQTGEEPPEPSTGVEFDGKRIYLCLEAGANAAAQLDALDQYQAQAAFFCTPEFLAEQGGVGLDQRHDPVIHQYVPVNGGDQAVRQRPPQLHAQGIADGVYRVPHSQKVGVPELGGGQVLRLHFQDRQVVFRVSAHIAGQILLPGIPHHQAL